MHEYSDYVNITRSWLKEYNELKASAKILRADVAAMQKELAAPAAAPIAKYGDEPAGGTPELNTIEGAAARKLELERQIGSREAAIAAIELNIHKTDCALSALPVESAAILRGHYMEYKTWQELSREYYMSEKGIRNKGSMAVKALAKMIFGQKAWQPNMFVFAE